MIDGIRILYGSSLQVKKGGFVMDKISDVLHSIMDSINTQQREIDVRMLETEVQGLRMAAASYRKQVWILKTIIKMQGGK